MDSNDEQQLGSNAGIDHLATTPLGNALWSTVISSTLFFAENWCGRIERAEADPLPEVAQLACQDGELGFPLIHVPMLNRSQFSGDD